MPEIGSLRHKLDFPNESNSCLSALKRVPQIPLVFDSSPHGKIRQLTSCAPSPCYNLMYTLKAGE